MAKDYAGIWRKYAVERLLFIFLLIGFLFAAIPHLPWVIKECSPEPLAVAVELGKAFIVAGILGLAIDHALKKDLVRDAVAASLGYLLPERLKPELRWLYDQKVIASQTFDVVLEHFPDKKLVVFNGTIKRRIENVSGGKTDIELGGGTDEWFSEHGETEIIAWTWKRITEEDSNTKAEKVPQNPSAVGIGSKLNSISIEPDEIIEVFMAYRLYMSEHGMEYLTFRYLIDRPSITIRTPKSLKVFVTFSHRARFEHEIKNEDPVFPFTLERVLLPHQDIKIHWHKTADVEKRIQKHGLKTW